MSAGIPIELGTEKVFKLLKKYAVPAIIAMTATSLYNIVDSIFIGRGVGEYAISGFALTFPIINLGTAFGMLVGIGSSSLTSLLLGQKNYKAAEKVLGNNIVMNLVIGILFTVVLLTFLDPVLYFFGASENTIGYARDYMQIILLGGVVTHLYFGLNHMLRASGFPRKAMFTTLMTVFLNILLDALFVYVFKMGIKGVAIATVLSQFSALIWLIFSFSNKNQLLHFKKGIYRPNSRIIRDIFAIGISPFMMNVASCMIVILINQGLKKYGGDLAVGAYGIVNRVAFVFIMIVMGINQGMQPIAGYNFGARKFDRLYSVLKQTIFMATVVVVLGFFLAELFPRQLVQIFTTDEDLISRAVDGMRIVFMFYPIIGFQMVVSNYFQSIGMAKKAIFLSLSRQLIILAPCLILLPMVAGVNGVWFSLPISDFIASIIALCVLILHVKQIKKFHNEQLRQQ